MTASLFSTDALPLVIVALAVAFAAIMTVMVKENGPNTFMALIFEGVTLVIAGVVVVSLFYRPLFEWITEHSVFVLVLALSCILNGLKGIGALIDRSRSSASRHHQDVR